MSYGPRPWQQTSWDWRAAANFMFGGTGAGLMAAAALAQDQSPYPVILALLLIAQFDHWATPYAKDFGVPSMNSLTPMSMPLTDATGSGADVVRVSVRKAA